MKIFLGPNNSSRGSASRAQVNVMGAFAYSFDDAWKMLGPSDRSFADELDARNPGAVDVIRRQRIPVHGVFRVRPRPRTKIVQGWPKLWANFRALIVIFSQSVGPSLAMWANPVQFSLRQ
jgi:hypothetical protein